MDLKSFAEVYWSMQEGKVNPGLQAYLDKKKGKKDNGDEKEEENGKESKGSKPDFLDLDKDGDKKEPMKKAAKEKKMKEEAVIEHHQKDADGKVIEHEDTTPSSVEEKNDNYVEAYLDELKKTTMGSYISKASSQLMKSSKEAGETSPLESGGAIKNYHMKKALKRRDGIKTAAKKMAKEETVLEQLAENGREIDAFEAVISYLIDEGFAESWEEAQDIMTTLKPELVEEVYQNQLKKLSK